jgi:hypothetical protein
MEPQTWYDSRFGLAYQVYSREHLQMVLLQCTFDFVNRLDRSMQNETGVSPVADPLMQVCFFLSFTYLRQTLFFIWIKSEVTSKDMWGEFQQKISSLVHWKATLTQWKVFSCGQCA